MAFPWLSEANREKVRLADELVQKSLQGCAMVKAQGGHFFLEHPEQLGVTAGQIPASIWDLPEVAELLCQKGGVYVGRVSMSICGVVF